MGGAGDVVGRPGGPFGGANPRLQWVGPEGVIERYVDVGRRAFGAVAGGEDDGRRDQGAGTAEPTLREREADKPAFVWTVSGLPPVMARAGAVTTSPASEATASAMSIAFRVVEILLPSLSTKSPGPSAPP